MELVRRLVVTVCRLGYWLWATAALGAAFLARSASEDPPFSEERLLLWLAFVSWLLASVIAFGNAWRRSGAILFGLWAVQTGLLIVAFVSTLDYGEVRIAPPLIALGIAGQLGGLLAIGLRPRPRPVIQSPPPLSE